ncbi:MAG: response regulator [bacterium]|nr:response regulator [bacterium]
MQYEQQTKILIVDDNPQYIYAFESILRKSEYKTMSAKNGGQAIEFAKKENPDLILLDIMMPEMDGYEVCKRLKKDEATVDIPVIFITVKTEVEDILKGFECGAVDYVTKPFNAAELLARIKTHIELKKAREEIKSLRGILPICARCKKIRDDNGYWKQVEVYVEKHSDATFSHSICPECFKKLYPQF